MPEQLRGQLKILVPLHVHIFTCRLYLACTPTYYIYTCRACNTRVRKRWPLQMGRPGEWRDFRSSKEPEEIQSCDPEAYNPKAVHIGPRHSLRCSPIFRQLKQHKCWRVNRLLQQSKHSLESMVQRLLLRLTPVINRNRFSRLFAGTIIGRIVLMLLFD